MNGSEHYLDDGHGSQQPESTEVSEVVSTNHHIDSESLLNEIQNLEQKKVSALTSKKSRKKSKKLKDNLHQLENRELFDAVNEVELKLAQRAQMNLTILRIEVNELPAAHRFTKNQPWLKASYGKFNTWTADYREAIGASNGETAKWKELVWSFNIERNESDRQDLVIAVCSQKLVIGKYILQSDEFANIPESKTGLFEIEGVIVNGYGLAGNIKLICKRGIADRPGANRSDSPFRSKVPESNLASPNKMSLKDALNLRFKIFVKLVSMALVDLKQVHLLEANSPSVTIECSEWAGMTEVVRGGGMSALWSNLNWKFAIHTESGIFISVHSNGVFIGKVFISVEEIIEGDVNEFGISELMRYILNGKEITGKIKLNLLVKQTRQQLDGGDLNENMNKTVECIDQPESSALNETVELSNYDDDGNLGVFKNDQHVDNQMIRKDSQQDDESNPFGLNTVSLSTPQNSSIQGDHLDTKPANSVNSAQISNLASGANTQASPIQTPSNASGNGLKAPLSLIIRDITVLDAISMHIFAKNSLSVNCVCGAWGSITEEIINAGQNGIWTSLMWNIIIKEHNFLRLTVWSRGKSIGTCSMSVKELMEVPISTDGIAEFFLKVFNEKKEQAAKIKIVGKLSSYLKDASNGWKPNGTGISFDNNDKRVQPSPQQYGVVVNDDEVDGDFNFTTNSIQSKPIGSASREEQQSALIPRVGSSSPVQSRPGSAISLMDQSNLNQNLSPSIHDEKPSSSNWYYADGADHEDLVLPAIAVIKSISVFDLKSVHNLVKNSPRVKVLCDRKSALTRVEKNAGSNAKWDGLDWIMKVNEDSFIEVTVTSMEKLIGLFQMSPKYLISLPVNQRGYTEYNSHIQKDGISTGKMQIIFMLKNIHYDTLEKLNIDPQNYMFNQGSIDDVLVANGSVHPEPSMSSVQQRANVILGRIPSRDSGIAPIPNALLGETDDQPSVFINRPSSPNHYDPYQSMNLPENNMDMKNVSNSFSGLLDKHLSRSIISNGDPIMRQPDNFSPPTPFPNYYKPDGMFSIPPSKSGTIFDQHLLHSEVLDKMGYILEVTLHELDVLDLKNAHSLSKNSPYVAAACGRWTETSVPLVNAGGSGYWTNLNWIFRIKSSTSLRLTVSSKAVLIGNVQFHADQLLRRKADDKGLRRILTTILPEGGGGTPTGKLKISYTLQIDRDPRLSPGYLINNPNWMESQSTADDGTPFRVPKFSSDFKLRPNNYTLQGMTRPYSANSHNQYSEMFYNLSMVSRPVSAPNIMQNPELNHLYPETNGQVDGNYDPQYGGPSMMNGTSPQNTGKVGDGVAGIRRNGDEPSPPLTGDSRVEKGVDDQDNDSYWEEDDNGGRRKHRSSRHRRDDDRRYDRNGRRSNGGRRREHSNRNDRARDEDRRHGHRSRHRDGESGKYREGSSRREDQRNDSRRHRDYRGEPDGSDDVSYMESERGGHRENRTSSDTNPSQAPNEYSNDRKHRNREKSNGKSAEAGYRNQQKKRSPDPNRPYNNEEDDIYNDDNFDGEEGPGNGQSRNGEVGTPKSGNSVIVPPINMSQLNQSNDNYSNSKKNLKPSPLDMSGGKNVLSYGRNEKGELVATMDHTNAPSLDEVDEDQVARDEQAEIEQKARDAAREAWLELEDFPFNIVIFDMSTTELKPMHKLSKNVPIIKIACDNFYQYTEENIKGEDVALWDNLNWVVPIRGPDSEIRIAIESKKSLIGSIFMTPEEIRDLPKTKEGLRVVVAVIKDNGIITGKLRLLVRLEPFAEELYLPSGNLASTSKQSIYTTKRIQSGSYSNHNSPLHALMQKKANESIFPSLSGSPTANGRVSYVSPLLQTLQSTGLPDIKEGGLALENSGILSTPLRPGEASKMNSSRLWGGSDTQSNMTEDNQIDSVKVQYLSISVIELPSVHQFKANSPFITLAVGKFSSTTDPKEKAGSNATWDFSNDSKSYTLKWDRGSILRVLVASDKITIGSCMISRGKVLNGRKDDQGNLTVFHDLQRPNGLSGGKIKLVTKLLL